MSDGLSELGVRTDCRHFRGDKPCPFHPDSPECTHYEPEGARILILKLGASGDVIRTTPLVAPLREREQKAQGYCHVTWLVDAVSIPLLAQTPGIDRLLKYSDENCRRLMSESFDLILNLEKEPRALTIARLTQGVHKLGFAPAANGKLSVFNEGSVDALRLGIDNAFKYRENTKSATEIYFDMAEMPYRHEPYAIGLSDEARRFAAEFAQRHGLDGLAPVVGVNTGCGDVFQTKQWTGEGFVQLARTLKERGCRVMLLGGPREVELNREIMAAVGEGVIDSRCDNTLERFMGIVNLCDLVISSDSMAMHVAIGLNKQVVAFFGPTCEQEIDLFGRGEKIVTDFACSPCYLKTCDKQPTCMMDLKAETIAEAAGRRLGVLGVGTQK